MSNQQPLSKEVIRHKIYKVRGLSVMLDRDLADFYETDTRSVNQVQKRHSKAFLGQAFQLSEEEWAELLRSQRATANSKSRSLPWVYTERGTYKLSIFLTSERAEIVADMILDAFFMVKDLLQSPNAISGKQREIQILESQIKTVEQDLKGTDVIIHNYFGSVNILNHFHTINNDLEAIAKIMFLKEHAPDAKTGKALTDAAEALREKDKGKIKKSMETINEMLDSVTKGQAAYNVLLPVYEILKAFF